LSTSRASAADDQLRVRELAQHRRECLDQETLPRQRVQALDVHQQMPRRDSERGTRCELRAGVVRTERPRDRRVDDAHRRAVETELASAIEQTLAVERHRRRGSIRAGEQIGPPALAPVMPDLGAVERQDRRLAQLRGEGRAHFAQDPVAVDVHEIGVPDEGLGPGVESPRRPDRADAERAMEEGLLGPRHPRHVGARGRFSRA